MADPFYFDILQNKPVSGSKGEADFLYEEMLKILRSSYIDSYSTKELEFVNTVLQGSLDIKVQQGTVGKLRSPYKTGDNSSYTVTSAWGPRNIDRSRWHQGIDLAKGLGSEIVSVAKGVVVTAQSSYGLVTIKHPLLPSLGTAGYTRYMHMSGIKVKAGQSVEEGQVIGTESGIGAAGTVSYAIHLHFEVRSSTGYSLDPAESLDLTAKNKAADLGFKNKWAYLLKEKGASSNVELRPNTRVS